MDSCARRPICQLSDSGFPLAFGREALALSRASEIDFRRVKDLRGFLLVLRLRIKEIYGNCVRGSGVGVAAADKTVLFEVFPGLFFCGRQLLPSIFNP